MSPNRTRCVALIGGLEGRRNTVHTAGHPMDPDKMLPVPDVLLLVSGPGRGAMVFRYTVHGDFAGDTWHESVDRAREQLIEEYDDALGPWVEVPDGIANAHTFAVQYAAERLNARDD